MKPTFAPSAMAPRTTPAPMPREPPVIRIFLFSSRRIGRHLVRGPMRRRRARHRASSRHAHAHAVFGAAADIVARLLLFADDLAVPAAHNGGERDAHLVIRQGSTQAAAMA